MSRCLAHVRRVAIIGAGNAGVTAAKYLLAEKRFTQIDIFEQRDRVGGLWNYDPENKQEESFRMPQTTADVPLEKPIWRNNSALFGKEPTFVSPMYERLKANLPKEIMRHSDMDFPKECQLFASHEAILKYLEQYAEDIKRLIHFKFQVVDVRPIKFSDRIIWRLRTKEFGTKNEEEHEYDAVVIASGHFNVSFVPDIEGVREWHEKLPDTMTHSKYFRRPEEYAGKKTITVGCGPSGLDMASQIALYCKGPLLISTRTAEDIGLTVPHEQRPEIVRFELSTQTVHFIDGTSESGIDAVLFCTGYLYSFPFFSPTAFSEVFEDCPISTIDGARPHNIYKYIFYNAEPTLAFLSMPQQIVPFPLTETQSAVISRVWAGRLDMPTQDEMRAWEEETVKKKGEGKKWLWLKPPEDGQYLNGLANWVDQARLGQSLDGHVTILAGSKILDTPAHGKNPARWGQKELWVRERVHAIRKAFAALGEKGNSIRTLEELGFDFEEWKRKA